MRLSLRAIELSPAWRAQSTVRLRLTKDINIFLTAFGRVKSGLKPAVKNRAMHGGEECAARMVKTKANALVIGGQAPIYLSKQVYPSNYSNASLSFQYTDTTPY